MVFLYKYWDKFCRELRKSGIKSTTARMVMNKKCENPYLILKHDVETNVQRAYVMASIEKKYGHRGSYYIQAYLLNSSKNIKLLKQIGKMGHEVSYHYDVMDSNKGNLVDAMREFEEKRKIFEHNGFRVVTVCQHGNPVIEREGYTSNRDFFRSKKVQELYPGISDIMVNFQTLTNMEFVYYSDAGRKFQKIYNPLNNDKIDSSEKNVYYAGLDDILIEVLKEKNNVIISTHPHRWTNSVVLNQIKIGIFRSIKQVAKILIKIPAMKKLMSKYYYLAKKL